MAERRGLVGVSEIAELLGVSKQRASVLASRKGFPDPVTLVIPVDEEARLAVVEYFEQLAGKRRTVSAEETWQLFSERASPLPDQPRLWRRAAVKSWAEENGRELR